MYVLLHLDPEVDTTTVIAASESADLLRLEAGDDIGDEIDGDLVWLSDDGDEVAMCGVYANYRISEVEVIKVVE